MTKRMWKTGISRFSLAILLVGMSLSVTHRAAAQGTKPALTINDEVVTEADVFDRLLRLRAQSFLTGKPGQEGLRSDSAGQVVLESIIAERLTLQTAAKAKVALTDEETNAQLANLKLQPSVVAGLTGHLYTEEMLKYDIRVQGARYKLATAGVKVSQDEIEKYYKAHLADYTLPEQWGLAVIRTSSPETLSKIQTDLKAGKSFAQVAQLYSEDLASKDKGGDIGTIPVDGNRIPTALKDAVRPLKPGEITPPVKLELDAGPGKPKVVTWWLLLLKSKMPETVRTLSDMKIGVERQAILEKAGGYAAGDRKIAEFRSQSDIKVNLPGYESLSTRQ